MGNGEKIKCINCQYYIENNNGYPFCCLYVMPLDNIAIYDLCKFIERENDSNKNEND